MKLKEIVEEVVNNDAYSTINMKEGLNKYGIRFAKNICTQLKGGIVRYNSSHYNRLLNDLYDFFEGEEKQIETLDRVVADVEKVLYDDVPFEVIDREETEATTRALLQMIAKEKKKLVVKKQ